MIVQRTIWERGPNDKPYPQTEGYKIHQEHYVSIAFISEHSVSIYFFCFKQHTNIPSELVKPNIGIEPCSQH